MNLESESHEGLKAGSLNALGAIALGAVMMAPALGIYANLGLISAESGEVAPAVFLLSLICTLPSAVSYALIARELPSAGSSYRWLSESINPAVGMWVGLLLVATYLLAVILQPMLFGLFFNELLAAVFGMQIGYGTWMVGVVLSSILVALIAYPGIQMSAKASIVLMVAELVVVFALSLTILTGHWLDDRVQFTPFNPARSLGGSHGLFGGLVFGLLSFVGFGVITTAAEETNSPRSTIPKVVVLACILLGGFWAFTAWGFCLALRPQEWADYVTKGINPVAVIAQLYWRGGSIVVILTAITSVLGVYAASMVGYARVAYAMGRDGTLPNYFGKLHPKYRVPWNAQHVVLVVTILVAAIWGRWLGLYLSYDWWGSALVLFAMVSNILVNLGCGVFFYRFRRREFSGVWHGFIPVLGIITSFLPLYYSFGTNLWQAGWKRGQSVILFCIFIVIACSIYTYVLSRLKPEVLQRSLARGE
ncbi:MAG: APC family permease [Acidobacteriota bacterium]